MATPSTPSFLSALDTSFLDLERRNQPLHIGSCLVYEGHLSRVQFLEALAARLPRVPRLRERVVETPFLVARPRWVADLGFDLEDHVSEVTLSADLTREEIGREIGSAFAGTLDRDRPLWHVTLLQGLACGCTVAVWKVHHAMIDGASGVDVVTALHDLKPQDRDPVLESSPETTSLDSEPGFLQRFADGLEHRFTEASERWADGLSAWSTPSGWRENWRRFQRVREVFDTAWETRRPESPFNGLVGPERQFATVEVSFAKMRWLRGSVGGTVNDVVISVLSGGLGRYMREKGVSTRAPLQTMVPVSLRRADARGTLGNVVSSLMAPLHVGLEDPLDRLEADRNAMRVLRRSGQARALFELVEMSHALPSALQRSASRFPLRSDWINTVTSHVPGPQLPLYLAGRALRSWLPLGPVFADVGLFVGILTYNQRLCFGLTVDPQVVPDVWRLARCIEDAYLELLHLASERDGATTPLALEVSDVRRDVLPLPPLFAAQAA